MVNSLRRITMSKGNSNFQHLASTLLAGRYSAEVDSIRWLPANSADDCAHFLSESSVGEPSPYSGAAYSSAHNPVDEHTYQRSERDSEEGPEPPLSATESIGTVDEAFELLSAYLDDEVTEEERCLVQHWIVSDPEMKEHYQKQLRLRQAFKMSMSDL